MAKPDYLIVTHVWANGPAQAIKHYFELQKKSFIWVSHPLYHSSRVPGFGFERFVDGVKTGEWYSKNRRYPQFISYLLSFMLNLVVIPFLTLGRKLNYIGFDNLNAACGILLKKFGFAAKVVYYVVDYVPQRFANASLNRLYHFSDQYCVKHADETWGLNEKVMNTARKEYYGFDAYKPGYSVQRNVPMGFWKNEIELVPFEKLHKHQIVFMGHMLKKQGVQDILQALSYVKEAIPTIKFVAIGEGEYLGALKELCSSLQLGDYVEFTGFLPFDEVRRRLAESALAIAPYEKLDVRTNFSHYTDSGKAKDYLGSGLPILISSVPPAAAEIVEQGCGLLLEEDPKDIAQKIVAILGNEEGLKKYRDNVMVLREKYDWNSIFGPRVADLEKTNGSEGTDNR